MSLIMTKTKHQDNVLPTEQTFYPEAFLVTEHFSGWGAKHTHCTASGP